MIKQKMSTFDKANLALEHLCSKEAIDRQEKAAILILISQAKVADHEIQWFSSYFMMLILRFDVPMVDIANMALEHSRPVNINWSAKRWKSFHDNLSRLSTLKALASAPVDFPKEILELAPVGRARRCVITNTLRLGIEGLRQSHCIAGAHYINSASDGSMVIASVVVQKKRWTVAMHVVLEGLLLLDIRGKLNLIPSQEISEEIRTLFNLSEDIHKYGSVQDQDQEHKHKQLYLTIAPLLLALGVSHATLEFSGGGDEGRFDTDEYFDAKDNPIEVPDNLASDLSDICEYLLGRSGHSGWENDSGGFGKINVNFEAGTFTLDMNYYFEDSENVTDGIANLLFDGLGTQPPAPLMQEAS